MLCDIIIVFCRRARVPVIHTAIQVNHEEKVAWFSFSMDAYGSVAIVMMLHLVAHQAAGALLLRP